MVGLVLACAASPARPAAGQVAPNRAVAYLHPTDVQDARALWVSPAGLAVWHEASVHLDVTVDQPGAAGRLGQVTFGFNSRGLSFGYQRDVLDGGVRGHTYRVGLAGRSGALAAGLATAYYRGDTEATGWDVGVLYRGGSPLTLGGVITNLGQPVIRGFRQRVTFVPSATLRPFGPHAAFSVHGRFTTDRALSYSFGLRWSWATRLPITLAARLDTDQAFRRAAFAFGISAGRRDVVGLIVTTPGDVRSLEAASLYGLAAREVPR